MCLPLGPAHDQKIVRSVTVGRGGLQGLRLRSGRFSGGRGAQCCTGRGSSCAAPRPPARLGDEREEPQQTRRTCRCLSRMRRRVLAGRCRRKLWGNKNAEKSAPFAAACLHVTRLRRLWSSAVRRCVVGMLIIITTPMRYMMADRPIFVGLLHWEERGVHNSPRGKKRGRQDSQVVRCRNIIPGMMSGLLFWWEARQ